MAFELKNMNTLEQREKALEAELNKVKSLREAHAKILEVLKANGFKTFEDFLKELGKTPSAAAEHKPQKRVGRPPKGEKKIRRPRVTAEQVAKMKGLRAEGKSLAVIAAALNCSAGTVQNWEARKFVFKK
jgi:DNA-binding transcriptional regulator YiaG